MDKTIKLANNYYFSHYTGLSKTCWQSIGISFIESILAAVYYFLTIYFVDVLHINISIAGVLISFYGLGTIIGGFVGGKLSDKFPPRMVSMCGLWGQGLTFLTLAYLKSPPLIALDLFLLGIATYSFITSNYVFILNECKYSEINKLKAINILSVVSNLGMGLAALVIGSLASNNFHHIFYLSAILFAILALFLALQQSRTERKISSSIELNAVTVALSVEKKNNLTFVLICLFFTGMIVSQLSTTYAIYLQQHFPQLGIHVFSLFFSLNTFLVVIFQNPLVNQFRDYNKLMIIGIGSFLIGLGMFLLVFAFNLILVFMACLIYTAGEMIFFSITQLFCYQQGSVNKKGSSLGIYRMVYAASRFVGPTAGGYIYYYLSGSAVWYFSGLIGVIFLGLSHVFKERNVSQNSPITV